MQWEKGEIVVDSRVEDGFIDFHFGKPDLTLKVKHIATLHWKLVPVPDVLLRTACCSFSFRLLLRFACHIRKDETRNHFTIDVH